MKKYYTSYEVADIIENNIGFKPEIKWLLHVSRLMFNANFQFYKKPVYDDYAISILQKYYLYSSGTHNRCMYIDEWMRANNIKRPIPNTKTHYNRLKVSKMVAC